MRILGIDPGTSLIGYGIIDSDGKKYSVVDFGNLRTASNIRNAERVVEVHSFFDTLIKKLQPDKLAIESLFFFKNAKTIVKVSEIRGVLLHVAAKNGLSIHEFTPLQVKQAVSSYGRAEKAQVQKMVKLILQLDSLPKSDDTADALALAICCANSIEYGN
ncbi:MAG: crossover junction endodeoxyribonuclease RuvC [Candidatus Yanofskybacteria bacterium]|nr:crossover junction endodeoxyribonuclease RuvC [Candidatus Yanofskybacteria bacterium]